MDINYSTMKKTLTTNGSYTFDMPLQDNIGSHIIIRDIGNNLVQILAYLTCFAPRARLSTKTKRVVCSINTLEYDIRNINAALLDQYLSENRGSEKKTKNQHVAGGITSALKKCHDIYDSEI